MFNEQLFIKVLYIKAGESTTKRLKLSGEEVRSKGKKSKIQQES